ncbi:TetR/AcrR family transcriptional regulator [Paracidovorax citrulli]
MGAIDNRRDNRPLLPALAQALVINPHGTLQDLANAVGISKATLYRFCPSREELMSRLVQYCAGVLREVIDSAQLEDPSTLAAFRRLNAHLVAQREAAAFLTYYRREATLHISTDWQTGWEDKLDAFFLRGQKQGIFRVDIPAPAMVEIWASLVLGLLDGERRGRVGHACLETLAERALLSGAGVR